MSRYIDADALLDLWRERKKPNYYENIGAYYQYIMLGNLVNEQPTVDAVPVRCKDCKYCYAEGFVNVRNVCEKHYDFGNVDDDWFCADGERRTDETDR